MSRERDAFDAFQPRERGRFGDNEQRGRRPSRVTGASDLVDLDMVQHVDQDRPSAVLVSFGDRTRATWLPRSLIEIVATGPVERKLRGHLNQPVRVTLPR